MSAQVYEEFANLNQSGGACHGRGLKSAQTKQKASEKVAVGEEAPDDHCPG
ncbi:hypothetical protein [Shewanella zhangzhouensis]|uniref:hypothetical protein n=1 Tax=Shewanella zhangzhouensis TaxID=2864213 RepID=UPI001C65CC74|nr:hypothetical protein [Shewanella zhangzhouensis]QYK04863.1 hypothetical protein K0H63_17720 [Shewanella zhangzhouensis]